MTATEAILFRTILIFALFAVLATPNIVIILFIFRKRRLRRIRFYIIANLSLADIVTLLALLFVMTKGLIEDKFIERDLDDYFATIIRTILFSAHIYSLVTTVFLAFDRYVAVKYSLKYENIMTEKRMIFALSVLSVLSTAISGIQWINVHNISDLHAHRRMILIFVRTNVFVLLFVLSFYTQVIRKRHIKKIRAREQYFGITKEKLDRLEKLKSSLSDSFKLHIVNVVILMSLSAAEMIFSNYHLEINRAGVPILLLTNLISHSVTQREIRRELKRTFLPCCQRKVNSI